jgi:hypothetical protein
MIALPIFEIACLLVRLDHVTGPQALNEPVSMAQGRANPYELSKTADAMKWYRDLIPSAPDDLNGFFAFLTVPPAPPFPGDQRGVLRQAQTRDELRKFLASHSAHLDK